MFKIYMLLLVLMVDALSYPALCQEQTKPLAIDDTLPELPFHQVINYPKEKLKLSDFKGKILILDFWNTWCTACLASFPKLHKIQAKFLDEIVIMPVVSYRGGNKLKYLDFFKMRKEMGMPIQLPSIVEDTVLVNLFPHRALPHVVWIDRNGKLMGVTGGSDLNEEKIHQILNLRDDNAEKLNIFTKEVEKSIYDESKPLLINGNGGGQNSFENRSLLAKNLTFKKGGDMKIFRDSTHTRVSMMNMIVSNLFTTAFARRFPEKFRGPTGDYLSKGIINESSSTELLLSLAASKSAGLSNGSEFVYYSYELIKGGDIPDKTMLDEVIKDLNRIFNVNARLEVRNIPALELIVLDSTKLVKSKYPQQRAMSNFLVEEDGNRFVFTNMTISAIVGNLNRHLDMPFIIDKTDVDWQIDMQLALTTRPRDGTITELSKKLKSYGLGFRDVQTNIEGLVIGD